MSTPSPIPDSILQRLRDNAKNLPDKAAVSFLKSKTVVATPSIESTWSYSQLDSAVEYLASRLRDSKLVNTSPPLETGDRVLLVYPPCSPHFLISFLACLRAGLVAVPTYPPHPGRKDSLASFVGIVRGSGARVALTNAEYANMKRVGELKDAFWSKIGGGKKGKKGAEANADEEASWPEDLVWVVTDDEPLDNAPSVKNDSLTPQPSDIAFLQYTSGSTSAPKGVAISHANLAHNLSIITNDLKASDDTVVVSWLPQYHDMGLIGSLLGILYCGGSGYYMSPMAFLQWPMGWIEAVSEFRGTHLQAPNFAFGLTARKFDPKKYFFGLDDSRDTGSSISSSFGGMKKPKPLDLSCIEHVINGAEPVTESSIGAFMEAFSPFGLPTTPSVIYPTYGLAEHTVFVSSGGTGRLTVKRNELEEENRIVIVDEDSKPATGSDGEVENTMRLIGCGFPKRQNVDVQIVDPEKKVPLGEDTVGEIWINSPSKAMGYFGKEDVTKEEFHAVLDSGDSASDGYLRSGDLGFLHNEELYICGRLKDLIIVGGRNHYPQDLEATAESISSDHTRPGCSAAFSISADSDADGEQVVIAMELKEPLPKEESVLEDIADIICLEVTKDHSLSISCIVLLKPRSVPKTTSGKISRSRARKAFLSGSLEEVHRQHFGVEKSGPETPPRQGVQFSRSTKFSSWKKPPSPPKAENKTSEPGTPALPLNATRKLSKEAIRLRLIHDISEISHVKKNTIKDNAPVNTMMDSVKLAQLKGLLEGKYTVKPFSDEYLFRDTATVMNLVEVIKIGYAPDDNSSNGEGGGVSAPSPPKGSTGLCCIVM